jgi:hypothetical protein
MSIPSVSFLSTDSQPLQKKYRPLLLFIKELQIKRFLKATDGLVYQQEQ